MLELDLTDWKKALSIGNLIEYFSLQIEGLTLNSDFDNVRQKYWLVVVNDSIINISLHTEIH